MKRHRERERDFFSRRVGRRASHVLMVGGLERDAQRMTERENQDTHS